MLVRLQRLHTGRPPMMVLTVWEPAGGADGGGYVWTDEHGWSADTPESPVSVLPLIAVPVLGRRGTVGPPRGPVCPSTCAVTV